MERISYLWQQYLANRASDEEVDELFNLIAGSEENEKHAALIESLHNTVPLSPYSESQWQFLVEEALRADRKQPEIPVRHMQSIRRTWIRVVAAAAVLIAVIGTGVWLLKQGSDRQVAVVQPTQPTRTDIAPGGYKAQLILDDGSAIDLDSAGNRQLARQGNMQVMNRDGQLLYLKDATSDTRSLYNTLKTARGQMYPVKLSDGSMVWLNASSSIRFPVAFNERERRVEITGEAYFEVAHDAGRPFKVSRGDMEVTVLGTHFNVNAYDDESDMKITLLEGSVAVSNKTGMVKLQPGEQAILSGVEGTTNYKPQTTNNINLEQVVAWKNGLFYFKNENLKTIMRQISRWYDVDVIFDGEISNDEISGKIYRNANLSEVLKLLNILDVNYSIEGKKLIIKG